SILSRAVDKLPSIQTIDPIEARTEIAKALEPFLGLSAAWCPIAVVREEPLKQLSIDLGLLGERVQEAQRDLTMRRCLIRTDSINSMIKDCAGVETRLGLHSAVLNDLQPELQQMWQEQKMLFDWFIVEECLSLRETARHVLTAAKQLVPYAACIESMSALIDPKRCHPPDPAPMESICMQITGIEPNSESRIQAIEKEEQNRRAVQEAKKREELAEREETASDLEMESVVWRENFELTGEEKLETVDLAIQEEERCSSSLSLTQPSSSTDALPSLEQLLGHRIPLANRVTVDVGVSHQSMLQSLHDVFASQRSDNETPVCEEPNMLASAVKIAQKMHGMPIPKTRKEKKREVTPETPKKTKKERRRRKKRSGDSAENREEAVVNNIADTSETMPERCSSSLSLTQPSSSTDALPSLEQLLGHRIPLANRVTVDVGVSHQSMLQSLHDVFASQRSDNETPVCEEPNMLASAVKIAQKMHGMPIPKTRKEKKREVTPETPKKTKKERRRRKKRSGDSAENREEAVVNNIADTSETMPVPDVPYIPSRVFSASDLSLAKLGSFEAKEKMLRSLREKMARSDDSS
ncbi:unnamed protein product, partial [Strongylus vulgaris]